MKITENRAEAADKSKDIDKKLQSGSVNKEPITIDLRSKIQRKKNSSEPIRRKEETARVGKLERGRMPAPIMKPSHNTVDLNASEDCIIVGERGRMPAPIMKPSHNTVDLNASEDCIIVGETGRGQKRMLLWQEMAMFAENINPLLAKLTIDNPKIAQSTKKIDRKRSFSHSGKGPVVKTTGRVTQLMPDAGLRSTVSNANANDASTKKIDRKRSFSHSGKGPVVKTTGRVTQLMPDAGLRSTVSNADAKDARVVELRRRNFLVLPHLQSHYLPESGKMKADLIP